MKGAVIQPLAGITDGQRDGRIERKDAQGGVVDKGKEVVEGAGEEAGYKALIGWDGQGAEYQGEGADEEHRDRHDQPAPHALQQLGIFHPVVQGAYGVAKRFAFHRYQPTCSVIFTLKKARRSF